MMGSKQGERRRKGLNVGEKECEKQLLISWMRAHHGHDETTDESTIVQKQFYCSKELAPTAPQFHWWNQFIFLFMILFIFVLSSILAIFPFITTTTITGGTVPADFDNHRRELQQNNNRGGFIREIFLVCLAGLFGILAVYLQTRWQRSNNVQHEGDGADDEDDENDENSSGGNSNGNGNDNDANSDDQDMGRDDNLDKWRE